MKCPLQPGGLWVVPLVANERNTPGRFNRGVARCNRLVKEKEKEEEGEEEEEELARASQS